jgi:acetate kinase
MRKVTGFEQAAFNCVNVLVINSGSATLKVDVWEVSLPDGGALRVAHGKIERFGPEASLSFSGPGLTPLRLGQPLHDRGAAIDLFLDWLRRNKREEQAISAVGHRVVHGGSRFSAPTLLAPDVLSELESLNSLAPLHNPPALAGIRAASAVFGPGVPMVAVFDTAFHQSLPAHAASYPLPLELARRHEIRRYGFHGLAHQSMLRRYSDLSGVPVAKANIVTAQLGSGCSVTAIFEGRSVDTSMGFTPLEGLMMGTRAGDLDPGVLTTLLRNENLSPAELDELLNHKCGLLGVSGISADMRELLAIAPGNDRAALAVEMFCYRAAKHLGALMAALNGAQAIVFGGGIGENSPAVRARICGRFEWLGLRLDHERNENAAGREGCISAIGASMQAWVVNVDESLIIARETAATARKRLQEGKASQGI